jgi:hypothetical protein
MLLFWNNNVYCSVWTKRALKVKGKFSKGVTRSPVKGRNFQGSWNAPSDQICMRRQSTQTDWPCTSLAGGVGKITTGGGT